jgi:hypothetical protein
MVMASLAYLAIATHTPIGINGTNAPHDDGLYIGHALNILQTGWLGPFDQLTLAKGPGYTLFLLAGYATGLSITVMHALFYLAGALCAAIATARLTTVAWSAPLTYVVLLFHPAMYAFRVTRDAIYSGQTLLIWGMSVLLILACRRGRFSPWLAASAGVLLGWYWLTREEGVWILPGLLLLFAGAGWMQHREGGSLRPLFKSLATFVAAAIGLNVAFAAVNNATYGKFVGVDFKEANFERALDRLQSVQVGERIPYIPVPEAVRMKVYAVSPAFAELRPGLDNAPPGTGWRAPGCAMLPSTCADIAGGWFVWAFRNAVSEQGYYASPAKASAYYRRLGDEIQAACDAGRLVCSGSWIPLMPPIPPTQLALIPARVVAAIARLTLFQRPESLGALPSHTTPVITALLGRPLQLPPPVPEIAMKLVGWYHAKGTQWFDIRCANGSKPDVTIQRLRSPDVAKALGDSEAVNQRFEMILKSDAACGLQIEGVARHDFPLADIEAGRQAFALGGETLFIDTHESLGGKPSPLDAAVEATRQVRRGLISLYTVLVPIFSVAGFAAWLAHIVLAALRRTRVTWALVAASALWVMIAGRIVIVVMVDVASFPAVDRLYLMPAFPLTCLASLLSIVDLVPYFSRLRLGRSAAAGAA